MRWLFLLLPLLAWADDNVNICYNYGCHTQAKVMFDVTQLDRISNLLIDADTPELERAGIRLAMGMMAGIAGEQTPTRNDRGGNYADDGVDGRMDCIDHSHNTTAYLRIIELHGWLRFHRVLDPVERHPLLFDSHWGARIEETSSGEQFIVDSWFFDNGEPAAIFPIGEWKSGAKPDG